MRAILLTCLLFATAHAQLTIGKIQSETDSQTSLTLTSQFSSAPNSGFAPIQLKLANHSNTPQSATITFDSGTNYRRGGTSATSVYTISAEPLKVATKEILVPIYYQPTTASSYYYSNSCTCTAETTFGSSNFNLNSGLPHDKPGILISASLHTVNGSLLDAAFISAASSTSTRYGASSTNYTSKFDPKFCPSNWLAYSGFDFMLLTLNDWNDLSASNRAAIIQWLNMGGNLHLYYPNGSTAPTKTSLGIPESLSYGSFSALPTPTDLKLDTSATIARTSAPALPLYTQSLSDMNTKWKLPAIMGSKDFNYGLILTILIAFAIIVGPVNLFKFASAGKRHRLFITTPIIALSATTLMIVTIIFQDGFGGHGIRHSIMEIRSQNGENSAYIQQEQFSRTGILSRTSFTINTPTRLDPVPLAPTRWARYTDQNNASLQFNQTPTESTLNASGSWWLSRSEQGQILSTIIPTRGRIETTSTQGEFLSTLDFTLDSIYILTPDQRWLVAKSIKTGQRFTPTPVTNPAEVPTLIKANLENFSPRNQDHIRKTIERPNHFFALSTSAPSIDTHPSITWTKSLTLVTGDLSSSH